tara:strand:+ start:470 stop:1345 length:876 start_codon:yes stop_codon:yes gene_type:complete
MPRPIIFGQIENIKEGHFFVNRKEMMASSFHRNHGQGIDGNGAQGTAAIVLSGGYEDDEDFGRLIIYTGAGGQDRNKVLQIEDQSWATAGNAGLLLSMDRGIPVRVARGHQHKSQFSPSTGYRYAGLYFVESAWEETGKGGFKICRFRLVYSGDGEGVEPDEDDHIRPNKNKPTRKQATTLRIVRDTRIARDIKELYSYQCQVCGIAIKTKKGVYAEGAHIKPLGRPHNGYDSTDNILCLCPNHHVMLDKGSFAIDDSFNLIGELSGLVNIHAKHTIDLDNLKYHRKSHGY